MNVSRRDFMKTVGAGAAAAGLAGYASSSPRVALAGPTGGPKVCWPGGSYKWFEKHIETCCPGEPLAADEMRITFLGTSCIPRLSQQGVSVYVEVGPTHTNPNDAATIPDTSGLRHVRLRHGSARQLHRHGHPVQPHGQDLHRSFACRSHERAVGDLLFRGSERSQVSALCVGAVGIGPARSG